MLKNFIGVILKNEKSENQLDKTKLGYQ